MGCCTSAPQEEESGAVRKFKGILVGIGLAQAWLVGIWRGHLSSAPGGDIDPDALPCGAHCTWSALALDSNSADLREPAFCDGSVYMIPP